jgi:hypothetical protein
LGPAELRAGPDWIAVRSGLQWLQLRPATGAVGWLPPRSAPGGDVGTAWTGRRFGPATATGNPAPTPALPEGAHHRGLRPWSAGHGWCWADEDLVFRADATGRVHCAGRTPGTSAPVQAGPHGAVCRPAAGGLWLAPRGTTARFVPLATDLRWSPDGRRAHLLQHGARGWLCPRTGRLREAGDDRRPADETLAYDPDQGAVLHGQQPVLAGLHHHPAAAGPQAVVGPHGRAWTAAGSAALPAEPRSTDRFTALPTGFAWTSRRHITWLDPAGRPLGSAVALPRRVGRPLEATARAGQLVFLTSRGSWSLAPGGREPEPCPPEWLESASPPQAGPAGWWLGPGGLLLQQRGPAVALEPPNLS